MTELLESKQRSGTLGQTIVVYELPTIVILESRRGENTNGRGDNGGCRFGSAVYPFMTWGGDSA